MYYLYRIPILIKSNTIQSLLEIIKKYSLFNWTISDSKHKNWEESDYTLVDES